MELKTLAVEAVEFKFDEARKGFFSGYASKFNGVDSYGDTILPGAYAQTLENRQRPIQMRWNHFGPVIGKWTKAAEDDHGLYVEGELTPDHSVASDVYASMKHGAVNGLSIGFRIPPGGSAKDGKLRQLKRIDLVEISVVETPADLGARIGDVKSAIDEIETLKQAEAFIRDGCGLSWAAATALVSQIKAVALRDGAAEQTQLADVFARLRQQARG
jgi:HK97 family phage prohead protease